MENTYTYEILTGLTGNEIIKRTDAEGNEAYIPTDPANSDYAAYLESLEAPAKATKAK